MLGKYTPPQNDTKCNDNQSFQGISQLFKIAQCPGKLWATSLPLPVASFALSRRGGWRLCAWLCLGRCYQLVSRCGRVSRNMRHYNPFPIIVNSKHPYRNHGLVGDLHIFGIIWGVFNIRGMGLLIMWATDCLLLATSLPCPGAEHFYQSPRRISSGLRPMLCQRLPCAVNLGARWPCGVCTKAQNPSWVFGDVAASPSWWRGWYSWQTDASQPPSHKGDLCNPLYFSQLLRIILYYIVIN